MSGMQVVAGRPLVPSVADIEAIGNDSDAIVRNLRITHAYHALAQATAAAVGPGANWCTFATWASRQAGHTIRGDDLGRKIEQVFADSDAVELVVGRLRQLRHRLGRQPEAAAVLAVLRETCAPVRIAARVADAIARGNKKVFDEIGREFARFVALERSDHDALERFCQGLLPGEPPDGQRLLAEAFRDYDRARPCPDAKARAERMLLANLKMGLHEQTRLQPEIAEALNACLPDARAMSAALIALVTSEVEPSTVSAGLRTNARRSVVHTACELIVERIRSGVRTIITAELMTLALPGGVLRLGRDLAGSFPEVLRTVHDRALREFLDRVDLTRDTVVGSGTRDWAELTERMHFIADLFRLRHEDRTLFGPPFTAEQVRALSEGRLPDGDL